MTTLIDEEARTIVCPRCEEAQPMRNFATLGMSPRYAWALAPIYRCKQCNHLFAPRVEPQLPAQLIPLVRATSGEKEVQRDRTPLTA